MYKTYGPSGWSLLDGSNKTLVLSFTLARRDLQDTDQTPSWCQARERVLQVLAAPLAPQWQDCIVHKQMEWQISPDFYCQRKSWVSV